MNDISSQYDTDVLIIGAGVLGCMAARELSRFKLDVLVLERYSDVCEGSSKSNSGLIHAGFHPRGGSLKGTACVQGNAMYDRIAEELLPFFERDQAVQLFDLGSGPGVTVKDRRTDHAEIFVEGDDTVHLTGKPEGGYFGRGNACALDCRADRADTGIPPDFRVLFGIARDRAVVLIINSV